MARVLLIGQGPLPGPGVRDTSFAQLRLAHFDHALRGAGHAVRRVELRPDAQPRATLQGWAGQAVIADEGPDWIARLAQLRQGAQVVVSAGPYNPARAACLAAGELPVWADVPGDPFMELQALAIAGAATPQRIAAAQAAILPVLQRADAFSAISPPQRHALIGQLGLLGRLNGDPDPVHTLPVAWHFPGPQGPPRERTADDPLVLALSGGFNAWFDHDTLITALSAAFQATPGIRLVCTGGVVRGQPPDGYREFLRWAATWPDRVTVHGWLPHEQVASALAGAHMGICLDRVGHEPELGSRTRVLWFAWQGMHVLATPRSAMLQDLDSAGLLTAIPQGSPHPLSATLVDLAQRDLSPERALQAARHLSKTYDPQRITAPLLAWVRRPTRLPPAGPGALDQAGAMARELARLRATLAATHASPTWRALSRLDRARQAVLRALKR